MSIDRIFFHYSQLSVSFTSVVSKMVLKVLELWEMNVNNTEVYIFSLKIISLCIMHVLILLKTQKVAVLHNWINKAQRWGRIDMEIIEKRSVKNVTMARRWSLNGQLFGMVVSNLAGVMRGVSCWEQANNGSPTKPPSHESFPQIKRPFEGCSCSPCLGKYFDIGVAEWPKWSSFKHRVWNRKWPQFCLAKPQVCR